MPIRLATGALAVLLIAGPAAASFHEYGPGSLKSRLVRGTAQGHKPRPPEEPARVRLRWPLTGALNSYFGEPRSLSRHTGIDIDGETGSPVAAAAGGRVVVAGLHFEYGTTVIIDHGEGLTTLYGHLLDVRVRAGDRVRGGENIGSVGCSGSCTGDHLHFEVRLDEVPVDPAPYLPAPQRERPPPAGDPAPIEVSVVPARPLVR